MYYVMSVTGYESYHPVWFESDKSTKEFKVAVKYVSQVMIERKLRDPKTSFLSAYDITGNDYDKETTTLLATLMSPLGFELIEPVHEVTLYGDNILSEYDRKDKPDMFSDELWDKILRHNDNVRHQINKEE